MKYLVIVESPTKARTIGKFLGSDYTIKASMGHLIDLPKSKLSIDLEHDFTPQYEIVTDKKKIIADLKSAAKSAKQIFLATDPDREGEAIASHVADMLVSKSKVKSLHSAIPLRQDFEGQEASRGKQKSKITRIVFHEITKEAIEEAIKNPRDIDKNLVEAQTARRVLDRLVGYKLSPILWQKVRRGLSAGRVQSVALRLIVEREREIEKFKKEEYWSITVLLSKASVGDSSLFAGELASGSNIHSLHKSKSPPAANLLKQNFVSSQRFDSTEFELIEINGQKIDFLEKFQLYDGDYKVTKTNIGSQAQAKAITDDLKTKDFIVSDISQREIRKIPPPPYTTSTLQQDASRRFGFSAGRTMRTAQKLYEEGYITYHRTDSVVMAKSAIFSFRDYIKKEFGEDYMPKVPRFYKTKQKLAQEAHEAIRPTNVGELNSQFSILNSQFGREAAKLYELIWKRAVASQMADAIVESTTVLVDGLNSRCLSHVSNDAQHDALVAHKNSLVRSAKSQFALDQSQTPLVRTGENFVSSPRLNSNNNYKLKANGSVLVFDGFLKINPQALGDKKLPRFKASEQLILQNVLFENHQTMPPPRYSDASLIKTLEQNGIGRPSTYAAIITTIEARNYTERTEGRFMPTAIGISVNDFLVKNFSTIDDVTFTADMEDSLDSIAKGEKKRASVLKEFYLPFSKVIEAVKDTERVKIPAVEVSEKCPKCGAFLVIRVGRFGKFLACGKFPECKFTKPFIEETTFLCPQDKGKIIIKKTRKGRKFYGCSNYPSCKYASWKLPVNSPS